MSNLTKNRFRGCLLSVGLVALISALGEFVRRYVDPTNLVMLYLLGVIISASLWGREPSIVAATISVVAFDFLFVPPKLTLSVADTQYLLTFAGLLAVGLVISELTSKMREKAIEARSREAQTTALYNLSRDLAGTLSLDKAINIILLHIKNILSCDLAIYLWESESVRSWHSALPAPEDEPEKAAIRQILSGKGPNGIKTDQFSKSNIQYIPLTMGGRNIGVLSYYLPEKACGLTTEKKKLLEAMANQAALTIERIKLLDENRQIELLHEKEKLQSALLHSISHDLRTPLVSITGSLSSLLQKKKRLAPMIKRELIETAYEESVRMNRLVGHLLDMARIEAGALQVHFRPCDLREIVGVALDELKEDLGSRRIKIEISKEIGDVPLDFFLMTKVITNLIDNAAKFSPPEAPIEITAGVVDGHLQIKVKDEGYGIPAGDLERVFNKFFRVERSQPIRGTGLGLSICRGLVELQGGRIWLERNEDIGTTAIIEIPLKE